MSVSQPFQTNGPTSAPQDTAADLELQRGDIVGGKYQVNDVIGVGGMGYVLSATHVELGEPVALKFLKPQALSNEELVGRFAREARAAARIKSEHVARVYDVGTTSRGVPFIVMEYLRGQDLAVSLETEPLPPVETAVEYLMQACEGLASAHSLEIVHRDIKPENLFITQASAGAPVVLKILDFGISKAALSAPGPNGSRHFVQTTMMMGSPRYMSPEQIRNAEQVDARTDIWSLGCVLYELLCGRPAFDAPSLMELGAVILTDEAPPLSVWRPQLPNELQGIVARCLQKDREARFSNVAELAAALYPYGPRRARMFAERCSSLLMTTNPQLSALQISSVLPPRPAAPVGIPLTATSAATTTNPVSSELAPKSTATPAVLSVPSQPAHRGRGWSWAMLVLAASVGVGIIVSGRVPLQKASTEDPAAPASSNASSVGDATSTAAPSSSSLANSADAGADEPKADAPKSSKRPRMSKSQWRRIQQKAAGRTPVEAKARPEPLPPSEPDVGF